MSKAIQIHETGGPEVLAWEDVEVGEPGEGEVKLKQTACGLNFIDTYHRLDDANAFDPNDHRQVR